MVITDDRIELDEPGYIDVSGEFLKDFYYPVTHSFRIPVTAFEHLGDGAWTIICTREAADAVRNV